MIRIVWLFIQKAGPIIIPEVIAYAVKKSVEVIKKRKKGA